MSSFYDWFRALHIIFVIFWMAGLFYLPRLFIYHYKAESGGELEQALIGQQRRLLKIIINPAMIGALFFGLALLWIRRGEIILHFWLPIKLLLVCCLLAFHGFLAADRKKFAQGLRPRSEKFYRIANELPPILTIFIVILAVVEPF